MEKLNSMIKQISSVSGTTEDADKETS